jgi:hypothetical protein
LDFKLAIFLGEMEKPDLAGPSDLLDDFWMFGKGIVWGR